MMAPCFNSIDRPGFWVVLLAALCILPATLRASHIIGGEMTYLYLETLADGSNRYEFTLTMYRDCDAGGSVQLPGGIYFGLYRGTETNATLADVAAADVQSLVTLDPVFPPCANVTPDILAQFCVERGIYQAIVDLPVLVDQSYFVVYQRCCRTYQTINLKNPDNTGSTYVAELNATAQALHNSSPAFASYPPSFICKDYPLEFNHHAEDLDGDSLVYALCSPLVGGGVGLTDCSAVEPTPPCGPPYNPVVFTGNYTATMPMDGNPAITINPQTGLLTGTPDKLGQYVVGICVSEYRNGQFLGSILRDFQFNTITCVPDIIAEVQEPIVGPRHFLAKRCGEKMVTILNLSPPSTKLKTWEWAVQIDSNQLFKANTWDLTVSLPAYGEYTAWLYLNRQEDCRDSARITMQAFPGITADFDFYYDVCAETPVAFTDSSIAEAAAGILSWDWNFGPSVPDAQVQNPTVLFPTYGDYPVRLIVVDGNDCRDTTTQLVAWQPQLPPAIPALPALAICLPGAVTFQILDSIGLSGDQLRWDFGDGQFVENEASPVHTYVPGIYTPSVAITTAYDCFVTDTFENRVQVYASLTADFSYLPTQPSNLDNVVHFTDQSVGSIATWTWQFGNAGFSNQPDPVFVMPDTGLVAVQLTVSSADGCSDSTTQVLDLVPKIQLYIPNAFRPDSDSGNERFGVLGLLPGFSDFHLTVWSRWGELLFESSDPQEGWNGRRGNSRKTQPPGVYVYLLTLNGPRGEPYKFEGTVTLL